MRTCHTHVKTPVFLIGKLFRLIFSLKGGLSLYLSLALFLSVSPSVVYLALSLFLYLAVLCAPKVGHFFLIVQGNSSEAKLKLMRLGQKVT